MYIYSDGYAFSKKKKKKMHWLINLMACAVYIRMHVYVNDSTVCGALCCKLSNIKEKKRLINSKTSKTNWKRWSDHLSAFN